MQDRIEYMKRVTAIHDEAVRRLVDNKDVSLAELAAFFEDIGNLYLNISEDIRSKVTSGSELRTSAEDPESALPPSRRARSSEDRGG